MGSKNKNKSKSVESTRFDIVFKHLEIAKKEMNIKTDLSDADLVEIDDNIKVLRDINESADMSSYTFFTKS